MGDTKALDKINKQIEGLEKKIKSVSGDHLTNTSKRQREQRQRDEQKEKFRQHLELMQYFKKEADCRALTLFESMLLTGTVYEEIKSLAARHQHNIENTGASSVTFDCLDEKMRKTLGRAGIINSVSLNAALERFTEIMRHAVTATDPNAKRLRELIYEARNNQGGDIQFTPEPVAEYLISLAGITSGSKVLEPEAGIASIADKAKEITPNVDCLETMQLFREILELKGHNLIGRNLLEHEQNPIYDAVVMNPPFSAEIEHIRYAFGFVKPGGTLVSVCSTRFTSMDKRGYPEFKQWLTEHGLYYENTESKFEKTGTASIILKIKKNISGAA